MGLSDSLKVAEQTAPQYPVCSIIKARENMSKDDLATLDKVLYDRSVQASTLAKALRAEKIDISETTITRHRNGRCKSCGSR